MTLPHDPQGQAQSGHLLLCACANIGVTVDGKVLVVGSRLHHRAGVHRHRPQGQSSPLWPQWAAAWPLVPHSDSRTLERPTPGRPSDLSDPICKLHVTQVCHIFTQPASTACEKAEVSPRCTEILY